MLISSKRSLLIKLQYCQEKLFDQQLIVVHPILETQFLRLQKPIQLIFFTNYSLNRGYYEHI